MILDNTKNKTQYLGIASTQPSNEQLLDMYSRVLTIIRVPKRIYDDYLFRALSSDKSLFGFFNIFLELKNDSNEYYEFNKVQPILSFNQTDEVKGKLLLESLGINNHWFICFHSRDNSYLETIKRQFSNVELHNFRDCNIENYLLAAEYITRRGGYALRVGKVVRNKIILSKNDKILDYATKFRTDFGDVYLSSKCKFFLGNTAGIMGLAKVFNIPFAMANLIPLQYPPLGEKDLFIPKKIWSIKKNRFLTFSEIINSEIISYEESKLYSNNRLVVIENTPEEILDLVIEMNERLDGTWKTTIEDEILQNRFKSLFKSNHHCYRFPSRISTLFLRKNEWLLDSTINP